MRNCWIVDFDSSKRKFVGKLSTKSRTFVFVLNFNMSLVERMNKKFETSLKIQLVLVGKRIGK